MWSELNGRLHQINGSAFLFPPFFSVFKPRGQWVNPSAPRLTVMQVVSLYQIGKSIFIHGLLVADDPRLELSLTAYQRADFSSWLKFLYSGCYMDGKEIMKGTRGSWGYSVRQG